MSKRIEFIDLIKSMLAKLGVGTLAEYSADFDVAGYTDNTLPSWRKVKDYVDANVPASPDWSVAAAGSANPIVVAYSGPNPTPNVLAMVVLSSDDTKLTIRQLFQQFDFGYTDNTYTTINSVIIYGNDDGSNPGGFGNLAEDVYYRVQG